MKRMLFLFIALLFQTVYGQETFTAGYRSDSILIDGKAQEWSIPFRFSDYKSRIVYNIKNDDQYLYFCFKSDSRFSVMKLLRFGFDIFIDTTGKKKKDGHIQFPMHNSPENRGNAPQELQLNDIHQMQLRAKSEANAIFVEGLVGLPNQVLSVANTEGIRAAIDFDADNALIIELAIPLRLIQVSFATSQKPWSVTLRMNAPNAPVSTLGGNGGMGDTDRRGGLSPSAVNGMGGNVNNGSMGSTGMNNGGGANPNMDMYQTGTTGSDEIDDPQHPQQMGRNPAFYESSEWRFKLLLGKP